MTYRFKPGDSVRTPAGHVGTVHGIIQLEKAVEVDVEIVAIERHIEGELDHADHSTILQLQNVTREKEAMAKSYSDLYRQRDEAQVKASTLEKELATQREHNTNQARMIARLSSPKPAKKKSRR